MSKKNFVHLLVFFSSIGGFLFGFYTSVISPALLQLEADFSLTTLWKQGMVSSTIGSAALCSFIGGLLNSFVGRRFLFLASSLAFVCGALCSALAPNKEVVLLGRVIQGVGVGFASTTSPVYISEIAPLDARGRLTAVNIFFATGGQFIAGVVGGLFISYAQGWRYMFAVATVPAAIQFIAFVFLPESPRWLVSQDRMAEARVVLGRLRNDEEAAKELRAIVESKNKTEDLGSGRSIVLKMFKCRSVRRALLVGCGLQIIQQLVGVNTVMYYSASIIKFSGVSSLSAAVWLAALVASVNFIFTIVGVFLVERVGRRKLTLASLLGVTGSLALLAVAFQVSAMTSPPVAADAISASDDNFNRTVRHPCARSDTCDSCTRQPDCGFCYQIDDGIIGNSACVMLNQDNSSHSPCAAYPGFNDTEASQEIRWAPDFCPSPYSWMATGAMVVYLAFFAPGMGPMPWTINAEIYPSWARSTGNGLATCMNWLCNLLISMTFLTLIEMLAPYGAFWLYCTLAALGCLFLFFTLPETRQKSLEEIENLFKERP